MIYILGEIIRLALKNFGEFLYFVFYQSLDSKYITPWLHDSFDGFNLVIKSKVNLVAQRYLAFWSCEMTCPHLNLGTKKFLEILDRSITCCHVLKISQIYVDLSW